MKQCETCREWKEEVEFAKDKETCKKCNRAKGLEKIKQAKEKLEKRKAAAKRRYAEHREKFRAEGRIWYAAHREQERERCRKYYQSHKKERLSYMLRRGVNDSQFSTRQALQSRIYYAIKNADGKKSARTMELVGCTVQELMAYLKARFKPGMAWTNHGEWHIDHIKPCASFDLTDPEQQKACFHYTNLQPLWGGENIRKGAKYDGVDYRGSGKG
jgi:hypothetical protein